jgi:RHS repeat-associated protein
VETGLDYFDARYYSSAQGRFASADPYDINIERQGNPNAREAESTFKQYISNPQRWNRYSYVLNNPLKYIDPDGFAEKLVVNLNIVYDKERLTEEQAKKAMAAQIADLKKTYGKIDIDFNITFTAGTAENITDSNKARISEGKVDGAINVFVTSRDRHAVGSPWSHTDTGETFINLRASSVGNLTHEVAHQFAFPSGGLGRSIWDDFLAKGGGIERSLIQLRNGWQVNEGTNWVDDYRNVKETRCCVPGTEPWRAGNPIAYQVQRSPTILDLYRVGARRFTGGR